MKDFNKIFKIIYDVSGLFYEVIVPEENDTYVVNSKASDSIINSLVELESILGDDIDEISESTFLTVAYEMSIQFESAIKSIIENRTSLSKDVFYFNYLPLVKSLANIVMVLDNWLHNPTDGNGISLVKIVPSANCYGMAFFENFANGEVIDIAFQSFNPFYVCAFNGEFTLCVCDFDEKSRTIFKENVVDLDMEVKALFPPFSAGDKYSLMSC
jgi:hypothetical protein